MTMIYKLGQRRRREFTNIAPAYSVFLSSDLPGILIRYLEQTHQNSSSFSTKIKNGISLTFVRFMIMVFVWPLVCGQHYI